MSLIELPIIHELPSLLPAKGYIYHDRISSHTSLLITTELTAELE